MAIKLVEDRETLAAESDAHFHQDPDFLRKIFFCCDGPTNSLLFTVCSNLNTTTGSLDRLYQNWKLHDRMAFFINWPVVELEDCTGKRKSDHPLPPAVRARTQ